MISNLITKAKENYVIILIMLMSISICFWKLGFGADQSIYPDETFFDSYAFKIIDYLRGNGIDYQLDPPVYPVILVFAYGIYFIFGMITGTCTSTQDFIIHFATHREDFIVAGRIVSAIFAVLAVYFTYKTARELFEKRVAHIAAFSLAICYPLVWFAHTVHHTTISAFISILILYFVVMTWKNPAWKNYLYTGIAIGIGIGIKAYPGLFALSLVLVHLKLYPPSQKSNWPAFSKLVFAGVVALMVACICYPWPIIEHQRWQQSIDFYAILYEKGNWLNNIKFIIWGKSEYYAATIAEPYTFWSNSFRILSETSLILVGIAAIFLLVKRPFLFFLLYLPFILFFTHYIKEGVLAMGVRQFYFLLPVLYIGLAYLIDYVFDWLRKKHIILSYIFALLTIAQPVYWVFSYLSIINNPTTIESGKDWLTQNVEPGAYIFVNYAAPFNNISTWETATGEDFVTQERKKLLPPFHIRSINENNFTSEIKQYCSNNVPIYIVLSDYNSCSAYYFYDNCKLWGLHKYDKFITKYAFYTSVKNNSVLVEQIVPKDHNSIGPSISIFKLSCHLQNNSHQIQP
jgi:hypothetical protein